MTKKTKIHDGIIGVLVLSSVAAGWAFDPWCLLLAGAVGAVMISSVFTGFCPIHYTIGKLVSD